MDLGESSFEFQSKKCFPCTLLINYVAVVAPISKNVLKTTCLPTGFQEYLSQDPFIWVTWMCSLNLRI